MTQYMKAESSEQQNLKPNETDVDVPDISTDQRVLGADF